MNWDTLTAEEITDKLKGRESIALEDKFPRGFFDKEARAAAVLIPFMRQEESWHLVFIRRTQQERDRHRGQVAFPGGRRDPVDMNIQETALREAHEEVALKPADVRILGQMRETRSITNYRVTPIVGVFEGPYPFVPDPKEAARVFTIPLKWLAQEENHRTEVRRIEEWPPWPVIYFSKYDGELLWGFTAKLVVELLEILRSE
jgi:8-oxo-dGTP pyrophosphatase MutT (NUDIX family)